MTSPDAAYRNTDHRVTVRASWAVFAVFFLNGLLFASWASRIPTVRDYLGLNKEQMGLLLLFVAIGAVTAMPLSGFVVRRLGAARTVGTFAVVSFIGLSTAALSIPIDNLWGVRLGLLFTGMGSGVWDAAMNLEGAAVEQRLGKAIMPRYHAGFSFGTMAGAGLGIVAEAAHLDLRYHLWGIVVICLVTVMFCVRQFLPAGEVRPQPELLDLDLPGAGPAAETGAAGVGSTGAATTSAAAATTAKAPPLNTGRSALLAAWTDPRTVLIGLVVLSAALIEGVANDWTSLAFVDGFSVPNQWGAVALTIFLTAMTSMRLLGTSLIDRLGRVPMLRICSTMSLCGVLIFALVPNMWVALVGVAFWGAGAALGFPMGMSAASDDPAQAAMRLSVVCTIGYSAFFIGPPLIGFLAEQVGIRHALLVVAIPTVISIILSHVVRPLPTAAGVVRDGAHAH